MKKVTQFIKIQFDANKRTVALLQDKMYTAGAVKQFFGEKRKIIQITPEGYGSTHFEEIDGKWYEVWFGLGDEISHPREDAPEFEVFQD